ncbi:MAG: SOUL family heme-binding protein [Bacteroidota bacterium]|jgi:hypothetical protein
MSKLFWIVGIVVVLITVVILVASFSNKGIETPEYEVLKKYGDVEIRKYPNMLVAKTALSNNSFENAGSNGFRTIANYIFGGNEGNQKIAMTAPVVMSMGDSASMYFVMPKQYAKDQLPKPIGHNVSIVEESAKVLAVLQYGGFSSDKDIKKNCEILQQELTKQNVSTKGSFMYMGYNAPWDVVNRRNEVAIEVKWE